MAQLLGSLAVPTQLVEQGLAKSKAGTPFELRFEKPIEERPYLGQVYQLSSLSLRLIYRLQLGSGQQEISSENSYKAQFTIYRGAEVVAIFPLDFQMRAVGGSESREWIGEATIFQDLTNPIEYSLGQTISFGVAGIVPGVVGAPYKQKPLPVEIEGQPVDVRTQEPIQVETQEPIEVEVAE